MAFAYSVFAYSVVGDYLGRRVEHWRGGRSLVCDGCSRPGASTLVESVSPNDDD